MALTIDDLRPKNFKVNIKGVELECKPLRMSHTLIVSKIGDIFQNVSTSTNEQITQAQKDMDQVIADLIPELSGIELDMSATLELITQMMDQVQPDDNKELSDKGVSFDTDPKAEKIG